MDWKLPGLPIDKVFQVLYNTIRELFLAYRLGFKMSNRPSTTFTPVELEFMQILWEYKEMTTEKIQKALSKKKRDLTDGSIRKVLSILMKKGYVSRKRDGKGFLYNSIIPKRLANRKMLQDLLKRAFNDSVPGIVAALLDSRTINEDALDEIKNLISAYEQGEPK